MQHYTPEDRALAAMLPHLLLLDSVNPASLPAYPGAEAFAVSLPDEEFAFLHEAAVIGHRGTLFAAWYNNPARELTGRTPIRFSRSADGGRTWTPPQTVADDPTGKILFCPPVFGIDGDRLYMLMNTMVGPDLIHSLDLYIWDDDSEKFNILWSRPIPLKLNTNVVRLPDGRLMLPGRAAELDGFPATPAVLLSDSGKIDAEWRLVKIQKDKFLPDGAELIHPELTSILSGGEVWMFSRDDRRNVPLVWRAEASCESWGGVCAHDIPLAGTKIYSGTLADGRHYLVGNLHPGRTHLAIFFSEPGEMRFTAGFTLQNGPSAAFPQARKWHYPAATEMDGVLYVICTMQEEQNRRGAVIIRLPLDNH